MQIVKEEFTDLVALELEGKTRDDILLNIARFAKDKGLIKDEQVTYQKFLERERLGTTAIGNGVALPEACWIEMSRPYAFILCRTKEPVEFNSLDGKPVRVILASLGGDKEELSRLKPISHFVKVLKSKNFRNKFINARTEEDIYIILEDCGMNRDIIRNKYLSRQIKKK